MFFKIVISFLLFIFSSGAGFSFALTAPIEHYDKDGSPEILITKLDINLPDQLSNQPQHFCPVHGTIMNGAFCKMKHSPDDKMKHASKEKKECFISIDDMSRPLGTETTVLHLHYKFAVSTIPDMALIVPCSIFTCSEFKDCSQGHFDPPDKPPKLLS